MKLELKNVTLEKVIATRNGVSAKTGNPWEQEILLINQKNGNYDNKFVVTLFGHDNLQSFHQIADKGLFDCDIYIDVREWQDKYFNDLSMGSFRPAFDSQPVKEVPTYTQPTEQDLPFD